MSKHIPNEVRVAFEAVRRVRPEVTSVMFFGAGVWRYFDCDGNVPPFNDQVDVDLLEKAMDAVDNTFTLPVAFGASEILS